MNKKIDNLVRIASELDKNGRYESADIITNILKRAAKTPQMLREADWTDSILSGGSDIPGIPGTAIKQDSGHPKPSSNPYLQSVGDDTIFNSKATKAPPDQSNKQLNYIKQTIDSYNQWGAKLMKSNPVYSQAPDQLEVDIKSNENDPFGGWNNHSTEMKNYILNYARDFASGGEIPYPKVIQDKEQAKAQDFQQHPYNYW